MQCSRLLYPFAWLPRRAKHHGQKVTRLSDFENTTTYFLRCCLRYGDHNGNKFYNFLCYPRLFRQYVHVVFIIIIYIYICMFLLCSYYTYCTILPNKSNQIKTDVEMRVGGGNCHGFFASCKQHLTHTASGTCSFGDTSKRLRFFASCKCKHGLSSIRRPLSSIRRPNCWTDDQIWHA